MMREEDADAFAVKLAGATERCVADYAGREVRHEESFSDQLCGRLKETLEDFSTPHIDWQTDVAQPGSGRARLSATTLTKTKEEPLFGADIVMALDVQTPDYSVRKGFLVQAKRLEPDGVLPNGEYARLLRQCARMISVTPSSMVFLYHSGGVKVVPAAAVLALNSRRLFDIVSYDIQILYRDFAICWYGDTRLQASDQTSLEGLRTLVHAEAAVAFRGRSRRKSRSHGRRGPRAANSIPRPASGGFATR